MSNLAMFENGSKVVISPDQMRAWVSLAAPERGVVYTAEAIMEWLPQKGVVYGVDEALVRKAVQSGSYDDLLEVARGKQPVAPQGGDYTLLIEKKPFTGLAATGDGALVYDDLSFLQEAAAGQALAEVVPPVEAQPGTTVTGEALAPRGGSEGRQLSGSGYVISDDGTRYLAPVLRHVGIVNDQLVVTPLKKVETLHEADGVFEFDGNLVVEGDITENVTVKVTGSIFVVGRAVAGSYTAGNNVLFCQGLRAQNFAGIEAKGHVWGQAFESVEITAGGDICANHLTGCEAKAGGRASIIGGQAAVVGTNLTTKNGVVAGQLGSERGDTMTVTAGLDQSALDNYQSVAKKTDKLTIEVQALQQNLISHERVNRMKADKGKNDAAYKEMAAKLKQSLAVLGILEKERTRLKRTMEQASIVSIIVKGTVYPGVTIVIDTRSLTVNSVMKRTRFRRSGEVVEATTVGS